MTGHKYLIRVLSMLLLALGGGCGGAASPDLAADQERGRHPLPLASPPGPAALAGLPAMPESGAPLTDAPRQASVNLSLQLDGIDYDQTNAIADSISSLQLLPNTSDLGPFLWAIYRFDGLSADANVSTLSAALSELTPGGQYYFALADYQADSWAYFARTAESAGATYNFAAGFDPQRHISPLSSVYFAVLTYDLPATIDFVSLQASTSLVAPQNLAASDGTNGQAVLISWDVVPGAELYEVFYKEAAQPDEFYGFLVETTGDTDAPGFSHTADFPVGKPAVYGVEYEYKVRATAGGDEPSPFSTPDVGMRRLPAPYVFYASDRLDGERVFIAWRSPASGPGPREWKVFRDGLGGPPAGVTQIGDAFFMADWLSDFDQHQYYVVETGPDGDSPPSQVDTGSAGEWQTQVVATIDSYGSFFADMEPAAHDPSSAAFCYAQDDLNQVMYGWTEGGTSTVHEVAAAQSDATLALANHLGRPWIAYYNQEPGLGTQGVYIARGKLAQPTSAAEWDTYLVRAGNLGSENMVLKVVGGRLALAYAEFVAVGDYPLHYLYALIDDPAEAGDWADCVVGDFDSASDSAEQLDVTEWQGLPLLARQGGAEGFLCQASSLAPADTADWTSYALPLEGGPVGRARGLELNIDAGQLYVTSIEGSAESDGRLMSMRPQAWPPGPADWHETHIFDSFDVSYGGLSVLFDQGRPLLAWSADDHDAPHTAFPVLAAEEELTWDLSQWPLIEPPLDPKYNRSVQEVSLRFVGGDLALLYVCRYNDGSNKYDLIYSQLTPGA